MPNDDDLLKGIRNIEEILQRLDDRAQNRQWLKEHAPQPAPEPAPKVLEPVELPEEEKAPAPEIIAPVKPAETPAVIPPVKPIDDLPAAPMTAAPIAAEPVKAPEPAPMVLEPVKIPEKEKAPVPEIMKPAEKTAPPAPEPVNVIKGPVMGPIELKKIPEAAAPAAGAGPSVPAKKTFDLNKNTVIFFCLGLAIAGGVFYQVTVNSAKARYARAGKLVKAARNAEAISAYTRIISLYTGSPEAAYSHFAIAEIKAVQGANAEAIDRYEKYLVAAPAGDAKAAEAKFKIAEIEFKEANFPDAEFLYQNAEIRASAYAGRAADRVKQIKAVKDQIAGARKFIAKDPARAVEALAAVATTYPGLKAAADGLEEARKALAAANSRPAAKARQAAKAAPGPARANTARAPKAAPAKPAPAKPAPAAGNASAYTKEQINACNALWMMEKMQVKPDAETAADAEKNNCAALKENMAACKGLQEEYKAIQSLKPEARALIEEQTDPGWTAARQVEQDKKTLKAYQDHRCGELAKVLAR